MNAMGQLVLGKFPEGAAESRLAGNFADTVPATEPAQSRPALERLDQRAGGGKLIDVLGDEGVSQP